MDDLQDYIYTHIPVVERNNFQIARADGIIEVRGKYKDHINHRNSVFGGSLSTALTLSAWAYIRERMKQTNCGNNVIVIQKQEVTYIAPVVSDFVAVHQEIDDSVIEETIEKLEKYGKAKVRVFSDVRHSGGEKIRAAFWGDFVIVKA